VPEVILIINKVEEQDLYMACKIKDIMKTVLIASCLVWVIECGGSGGGSGGGSSGSNNDSSPSSQSHPTDHQAAFLSDQDLCRGCHGADLLGGDAGVSCYSSSFAGASCHASGPNSHPDGWADPGQHGTIAKTAPDTRSGFSYCQKCHGEDFSGGFINVSCFTCHGVNAPHSPAPWRNGIRTHIATYGTNAQVCALCHTNGANSTLKPNPFAEGTEPGCFNNTLCHDQRGHEAEWTGNAVYKLHGSYVDANGTSKCENQYCHGALLTGVTGSGPSCSTCHAWPAYSYSPGTLNCSGCHDYPPSGTRYPDTAGKHAKHTALDNVDCSSCHTGAGDGTANHYNDSVEVSFASEFDSKSGTASFDASAKKCSNISCHGGPRTQTSSQATNIPPSSTPSQTPHWLNGTITVNTQCKECHVRSVNAEYNSYYSGKHRQHVFEEGISCTECHDTAKLTVSHFTNLNTPAVSGAADTILDSIDYAQHYYLGIEYRTCTLTCHGETHDEQPW